MNTWREGAMVREGRDGLANDAKDDQLGAITMDVERLASVVIGTALTVHSRLGPGLLEGVYEVVLARKLEQVGLRVDRQKRVPYTFEDLHFEEAARLDLLIENRLVVELKSIEILAPIHTKQVLTYLRLLDLPLGLLLNFGAPSLRFGIKRVVNNHLIDPFKPQP